MPELKKLSTNELITKAYDEKNDDRFWDIIWELRFRGTETEYQASVKLIESDDPVNREIGATILSQLDAENGTYLTQATDSIIPLLYDSSEDVIEAAVFGLSHTRQIKSIPHLMKLIDHDNDDIRHGVALALSGFEDETAVAGLIKLTTDLHHETRNWATFGLGQQCEMDTPAIRKALKARLTEEDHEIRGEALIGLANRKDGEIKTAIMKELEGEFHGTWAVEAAETIADPDFIPALEKILINLKDALPIHMVSAIEDAIKSCSSGVSKPSVFHKT